MYHVERSHPGIVSKDMFQRVQTEMARQSSKRKVL